MSATTPQAAGEGPFRVILRMEIHPGKERDFEEVWLSVGESIAEEPENRGQTLIRSHEEDGVYFVVSDWTSARAFRAFEVSERHTGHRRRLGPFRRGGHMAVGDVVHRLAPVRTS